MKIFQIAKVFFLYHLGSNKDQNPDRGKIQAHA